MCWNLGNILSVVGILASVTSIFVALYIYNGWTAQKQKEVVANDAGIIMEEIESLRQKIRKAYDEGTVDNSFILYLKDKHGEIESTLSMIKEINEKFAYEHYTKSLSVLITKLEENPNSISEKRTVYDVLLYTIDLGYQLRKLRLYIWN